MRSNRNVFILIAAAVLSVSLLAIWLASEDFVQASRPSNIPGIPVNWQLNFQWPSSPTERSLYALHNYLLAVDVLICALVVVLILYVSWRYRRDRNPTPSSITHNTALEITWTILPILVLLSVALPSFHLLAQIQNVPHADLTLKVTGHQWYWDFQYPDNGGFTLSSLVVADADLKPEDKPLRNLAVDNYALVPVGSTITFLVTASDVIHGFSIPSLGIKRDAIPGQVTAVWTRIETPGLYFGQCSVLCGPNHPYMPIALKAVSNSEFVAWTADKARKK